MGSGIFNSTFDILGKVLDLRHERHKVIAGNIANKDTPRYRAKELLFEDALKTAANSEGPGRVVRTHPTHLPTHAGSLEAVKPIVQEVSVETVGQDENTVRLEHEMVEMAANTIMYQAATKFLSKKLGMIKYAIMSAER